MAALPEIGKSFAVYRVEGLLGRGGMGAVFLATHERLRRKVALKVIVPEAAEDIAYQERFIRESELAASLEHPNVIPIYDAGEFDGVLYIAMRFIEGQDLRRRLGERGRLGVGDTGRIVDQISGALDAAHAADLVHRDLKPANILIEAATETAFLTDFGVAKRTTSAGPTVPGTMLGTVDYCPPEQIHGQPLDGRADIYAFGAVVYHCLAGAPPFPRETEVAVMQAQLNDPLPALSTVQPGLPPALDGVLATAMAKYPPVRYSSAGSFAQAYETAVNEAGTFSSAAPPQTPPVSEPTRVDPLGAPVTAEQPTIAQKPGRSRWLIGGAVAAGFVALAAGAAAVVFIVGDKGATATSSQTTTTTTTTTTGTPSTNVSAASFSSRVSDTLAPVATAQQVVASLVSGLSSDPATFTALRRAATALRTQTLRAEGAAQALAPSGPADRSSRKALTAALAADERYAGNLADLPAPASFSVAVATRIGQAANHAQGAYDALGDWAGRPCCPKLSFAGTGHLENLAEQLSRRAPRPRPTVAPASIELARLLIGPAPDDPAGQGRCFGGYTYPSSLTFGGVKYRSNIIQCGDYSTGDPSRATGEYTFAAAALPAGTSLVHLAALAGVDDASDSTQFGATVTWTVYYYGQEVCSTETTWDGPDSEPVALDCELPAGRPADTSQLVIDQSASLASGGSFWAGLEGLSVTTSS